MVSRPLQVLRNYYEFLLALRPLFLLLFDSVYNLEAFLLFSLRRFLLSVALIQRALSPLCFARPMIYIFYAFKRKRNGFKKRAITWNFVNVDVDVEKDFGSFFHRSRLLLTPWVMLGLNNLKLEISSATLISRVPISFLVRMIYCGVWIHLTRRFLTGILIHTRAEHIPIASDTRYPR